MHRRRLARKRPNRQAGSDQFKCFKFATHYWLALNGVYYDVCFDNVFHNRSDIVWTTLVIDTAMATKCRLNLSQLRKLAKPLPAYQYIVEVQSARLNPNGWPGWQLVSAEQLKKLK